MKELSNSGSANFGSALFMLVLSVVSVAIRFALRRLGNIPLSWSDWLILLGLAAVIVDAGLIFHYIVDGPGPGTYDLNEIMANYANGGADWGVAVSKELYAGNLVFTLAITLVKLSILTFSRELFAVSKTFKRWNWAVSTLCIIWFIVFTFFNAFQCSPPSALWEELASTEYCSASGPLWLSYEMTNFFLDVLILCLPVVMVHRLQLRTAQKWSVASIFLFGGLVCIVSIVRMSYLWIPGNPDYVRLSETQILGTIQLGIAVLCACLPTYGPLLPASRKAIQWVKRAMGLSVPKTWDQSSRNEPSTKILAKRSEYFRMGEAERGTHTASASANGFIDEYPLSNIPTHSIIVSKSVQVT